jgi:hypothetical protein
MGTKQPSQAEINGMRAAAPTTDRFGRPIGAAGQQAQVQAQAAAAKAAAAKAEAARPKMAKYENMRGPDGSLKSQFQLKDPGAVKSPWMDQMLQQQDMMQTQALNRGAQQAATAAAQAQASMARKGGLSSGAAERMAGAAQEQQVLGAQNIYNQGAQQRLGMQTADMQNERQYQTGLQESNLQNTLKDVASKREFDLGKYSEDMKKYAADKSAEATEKGGGGSVVCTALRDVGIINDSVHRRAQMFRSDVSLETYEAYLTWGVPVANAIRAFRPLGYLFLPMVKYWAGNRGLLAVVQYNVMNMFNNLFKRQERKTVRE